jgi:hypothetical protein
LTLKTLIRKLYMPRITELQIMTATCWVLGSLIRGTFRARAIVEKERRASEYFVSVKTDRMT